MPCMGRALEFGAMTNVLMVDAKSVPPSFIFTTASALLLFRSERGYSYGAYGVG